MPNVINGNIKWDKFDSNLLALYKLDSNADGIIVDSTGRHNGVVTNTSVVAGKLGNALHFDNSSSNAITLPTSLSETMTSMVVCGYVYPDDVVNAQRPIVCQWFGGSFSWLLDFYQGNMRLVVSQDGSGSADIISTPASKDAWHFVVAWAIDGEMGIRWDMGTPVTMPMTASELHPGGVPLKMGTKDGAEYVGDLDQFRFFKTLPSDEELQSYMDETIGDNDFITSNAAGIQVSAIKDNSLIATTTTDSDGNYSLDVGENNYVLINATMDRGIKWTGNTTVIPGDIVYSSIRPPDEHEDSVTVRENFNNDYINLVIFGGNPTIDSAIKKNGHGSLYLDGAASLHSNDTTLVDLQDNDFTIETWAYPTVYSSPWGVIVAVFDGAAGTSSFRIILNGSDLIFNTLTDGQEANSVSHLAVSSTLVPLNTWTHIAYSRIGNNFRLFINGNLEAEDTNFTTTVWPAAVGPTIGDMRGDTRWEYQGYLDDLRVTLGVGRYSENFTPPSSITIEDTQGYIFECTTGGTTGGTEPEWNIKGDTPDNDVVWTAKPYFKPEVHGPIVF